MEMWTEMSVGDRAKARKIAMTWKSDHEEHVGRLTASTGRAFPPSGSDCFRPELWKPEHWNFLFSTETE
jgi:hypothetical protein